MPSGLLLLPLLGGFVFISFCNRFRFVALRLDGYRLLIHASIAGVALLVLAQLILFVVHVPLTSVRHWWHSHVPYDRSAVSLLAFDLGWILWWPINRFFDEDKEAQNAAEAKADALELFLRDAATSPYPVLISLKSGKVYLGKVVSNTSPAVAIESVMILPSISGYRDEKKQVWLTTSGYQAALANFKEEPSKLKELGVKRSDLHIVLPVREIESVHYYIQEVYELFFKEEEQRKSTDTTETPKVQPTPAEPVSGVMNG